VDRAPGSGRPRTRTGAPAGTRTGAPAGTRTRTTARTGTGACTPAGARARATAPAGTRACPATGRDRVLHHHEVGPRRRHLARARIRAGALRRPRAGHRPPAAGAVRRAATVRRLRPLQSERVPRRATLAPQFVGANRVGRHRRGGDRAGDRRFAAAGRWGRRRGTRRGRCTGSHIAVTRPGFAGVDVGAPTRAHQRAAAPTASTSPATTSPTPAATDCRGPQHLRTAVHAAPAQHLDTTGTGTRRPGRYHA